MSDRKTDHNNNPISEALTEDENTNFYVVEKVFGHETRPIRTRYTARWYFYEPHGGDIEYDAHTPNHFLEAYWGRRRKCYQGRRFKSNKGRQSFKEMHRKGLQLQ